MTPPSPPAALPAPPAGVPVPRLVADLARRLGRARCSEVCCDLLAGADREDHLAVLPWLTGHAWADGDAVRDPGRWKDHWVRHWGARGLLHLGVAEPGASAAVVAGLGDPHWRPAETCLRVVAAHDVAAAGDGAAALTGHDLPRVRVQAARALAVVGDTEHAGALHALRDDPEGPVRAAAARAWDALALRLDLAADPSVGTPAGDR